MILSTNGRLKFHRMKCYKKELDYFIFISFNTFSTGLIFVIRITMTKIILLNLFSDDWFKIRKSRASRAYVKRRKEREVKGGGY